MRRVLIVSPHFPPVNAPDMQRARQCLPYLAEFGWEAEVLAVDPADVIGPQDRRLAERVPASAPVYRVPAPRNLIERLAGSTTLGRRARRAFARPGAELLRDGKFDLVLFTTTQFSTLRLGPEWKRRFGIRYVIDWQDPWLKTTATAHRPGGWRYGFADREARQHEPTCARECAGTVATNRGYLQELQRRYAELETRPAAVIPFGFELRDYEAGAALPRSRIVADTGITRVLYVGAVGGIMREAVTTLLEGAKAALAQRPELRSSLRLMFVGTSYAPPAAAQPSVMPIARDLGVAEIVEEHPGRIEYDASLRAMMDADALLIFGSEDPSYVPSKLAAVATLRKPTLAVVRSGSELEFQLVALQCAAVTRFGPGANAESTRIEIAHFLLNRPPSVASDEKIQSLSARARTRELCLLLDQVCERR